VAPAAPPAEPRRAERRRATKETTIEIRVDLDEPWLEADQPAGVATAWCVASLALPAAACHQCRLQACWRPVPRRPTHGGDRCRGLLTHVVPRRRICASAGRASR
jgi:hypothetical protein